jgi:excisionase family DNA binding protein
MVQPEVSHLKLLKVKEVQEITGLSEPTLRRLIACGALPVVRNGGVGSAVRVRKVDLERYIESRLCDSTGEQ